MLIAAGGHIIIVQLAPIVVIGAGVYYLGAFFYEDLKATSPETWMWSAGVIGVILMVALIGFAADGCITQSANNNQIREAVERERKSAEEYLKGAPARAIAEKEREQYEAALPAKRKREAEAALEALEAQRKSETVLQQEQARKDAIKKE